MGECGNLVIGKNVEAIGEYSFNGCKFNGSLTFAENSSLKTIGSNAFINCSSFTGDLMIPASVTQIGNSAFYSCSGFNGRLDFGNESQLKTIGNYAFWRCKGFTGDLKIPSNVETIGNNAFTGCNGFNGTLTFEAGSELKTIGNYAFSAYNWNYDAPKFTGDLTLPEGLETIGDHAFYCCKELDGYLTLPSTLKVINNWAFYECTNLKSQNLIIPDTVEVLGNRAFANCESLSGELHLPQNSNITAIEMNTFYNCYSLTGNLNIPSNIKKIGYGAFAMCRGFNALELNEGLEEISASISGEGYENYGSFRECTGFKSNLTIPKSVKVIGQDAFHTCRGFNGYVLTIPEGNSLTEIGKTAFAYCNFNNSNSVIYIARKSTDTVSAITNINDPGISTSAATIGDSICYGYQVKGIYFIRDN